MSKGLKLLHKDGTPVKVGDEVTSFRGEKAVVTGWPKNGGPNHLGLRNRVWVKWQGGSDDELFPTVFDLKWEAAS